MTRSIKRSISIILSALLVFSLSPFSQITPAQADDSSAALSSIIYNDEMYTTIYTTDGILVASNDPNVLSDTDTVANKVTSVQKGQNLLVHFRMASIIANDGAKGVQEGTTYTLDLPTTLVPTSADVTTFMHDGDVTANGQIVDSKTLEVAFASVADRVDVSGEFQYSALVSDEVQAGQTVNLDDVPGGPLTFKITPDTTPSEPSEYTLQLTANKQGEDSIYWNATVRHDSDEAFEYGSIEVTLNDAQGFLVDSSQKTLNLYVDGTNLQATGSGNTFTFSNGVTVTFDSSAKDGLQSSSQTITAKATITIPSGLNPKLMNVGIPAIAYDDYKYDGSNGTYTASAVLTKSTLADINASGSLSANYGSFSSPTLYLNAENPVYQDVYTYTASQVDSRLFTGSKGYFGNYYWVEYEPQTTNTSNSIYYISNKSFLPGNSLMASGESNNTSSFTASNSPGTYLDGMGDFGGWSFATLLYGGQVSSISNIMSALGTGDVKVAYQISKVFEGASSNAQLVVYKSNSQVEGKTAYIVVDPSTNEMARQAQSYAWSEYIEGSGSAKAATWKLHIFNAPHSQFVATSCQQQGVIVADDNNQSDNASSGQIVDNVRVGNAGTASATTHSTSANATVYRFRASKMDAVRVDDDTIFWEMTIPVSQLPELNYGGYFYALAGQGLYLSGGTPFYLDEQQLYPSDLYVKRASGSSGNVWKSISSSWSYANGSTGASIDDMSENSTLSIEGSENVFRAQFSENLKSSDFVAYDGTITIGYATLINGDYASYNSRDLSGYYSVGQVVFRNSDVSRFAGTNGNTLPTSASGAPYQFPFKFSASASTTYPEMAKTGTVVTTDSGADATSGKTTINWDIAISGLENLRGGHINSPLFYNNNDTFYGYYNGRIYVGDSMKDSTLTNATGEGVNVSAAQYTYVTEMFTHGVSAGEYGNGGGCGPIPNGSNNGDSGWQRYVNGTWVSTSSSEGQWSATEPGIYKRTLTTSNTNSESNPFELYVYYAGNMNTSVRTAFASAGIASSILDLSNSIMEQSLVFAYDGLEHAQNSTFSNGISYTTQTDDQAILSAVYPADSTAANKGIVANLTNSATCSSWARANKSPQSSTVSKSISADLSIFKSTPEVNLSAEDPRESVDYSLKVQSGNSQATEISLEDFITKYKDSTSSTELSSTAALQTLLQNATVAIKSIKQVNEYGEDITGGEVYDGNAFCSGWSGSSITLNESGTATDGHATLFNLKLAHDTGYIYQDCIFEIDYTLTINMDDANGGLRDYDGYEGGKLLIYNSANATRDYKNADDGSGTLSVACDGEVEGQFLADPNVIKSVVSTSSDGTETKWLVTDWTGSTGKGETSAAKITDALTAQFSNISGASDDTKSSLAKLLVQYLSVGNVKACLTDKRPTASDVESATGWSTDDGTASSSGTINDAGGTSHALTYTPIAASPSSTSDDNFTYPGFEITVADVARDSYLSALYTINFDKSAFFAAAKAAGLIDDNGFVTGTHYPLTYVINNVAGNGSIDASATSGRTQIKSSTLSKGVSAKAADGSATWTLTGNTGKTGVATEIKFTDTLTFSGSAADAAKAATKCEVSSVKVAGKTLDANAYTSSYTDGVFTLTITSTEGIAENSQVVIVYKTSLDKDAFMQASNGSASYTIANSAVMDVNGSSASATRTATFEPEFPVSLDKTKVDSASSEAKFNVNFSTGAVDREDIVITDALDEGASDADALSAILINEIAVTIDGTPYTKDSLPAGCSLETNGGNWTLTIASLGANKTVSVDYTLWIDRDSYAGEIGKALSLLNKATVTTKDGSGASTSANGSITVAPDISKKGELTSEKSNGNPVMKWTFEVNLTYKYPTAAELAELKNVVVKDKLDARLKYLESKGTTFAPASGDLSATLGDNNTLQIAVNNPSANSMFTVTFYTEVAGSIDEITNAVDLEIDGEKISGDKFTTPTVIAVAQYGYVTSAKAPVWQPVVKKTVDGAAPGDNTFTFIMTDDNGNQYTGQNDADGNISFGDIEIKTTPIAGTHTYHVKEDLSSVGEGFDADTATYDITVTVSKDGDVYTAVQNGDVTFKNTTSTEPNTPDKPNTPDTPDKPNTPGDLVNTGDVNELPIVAGILILAATIATAIFLRRK